MCPIKHIRIRKNSPPCITHEIVEMINDRNVLFKLAHNDPNAQNVRNARRLRNHINTLIATSKSTYIKDTLNNNKDNPKNCWRILNQTLLKGNNENSDVVFDQGNGICTDTGTSCDFLNDHLADVGVQLNAQFEIYYGPCRLCSYLSSSTKRR